MVILARITTISHYSVTNKGGKMKCAGTLILHSKKRVKLSDKKKVIPIVQGTKGIIKFYRAKCFVTKSLLLKTNLITYIHDTCTFTT